MDAVLLLAEVAEGTAQLIETLLGLRSGKGSVALPAPAAAGRVHQQRQRKLPEGDAGPRSLQLLCSSMRLLLKAVQGVLRLWSDLPSYYLRESSRVDPRDGKGGSPLQLLEGCMLQVLRSGQG